MKIAIFLSVLVLGLTYNVEATSNCLQESCPSVCLSEGCEESEGDCREKGCTDCAEDCVLICVDECIDEMLENLDRSSAEHEAAGEACMSNCLGVEGYRKQAKHINLKHHVDKMVRLASRKRV